MARRWQQYLPLLGVLALGAFLRLFLLNYGEYQWDDDGIWSLAWNAVRQHALPAKGINSTIGTGKPLSGRLFFKSALGRQPYQLAGT